ncbi:methyltransferase oms1 [Ophiostoma piceae UAMH 11346]|uniref:Methyltransferase oms1 n=1 Tax=Ophiostoma piceae (strain UAMH 11346) TaxID=1262450 RepID=S3C9C9_OPHP1|nr:methyltransferase oms1 [Ophiostoma piceae UAMH 11346]
MSSVLGSKAASVPSKALRTGSTARKLFCPYAQQQQQQQQQLQYRQPQRQQPQIPCRWLSMRATAPLQRRPGGSAGGRGARKNDPRSDIWPESVNSPGPKTAYRHKPMPYESSLPPKDFEQHVEYEKDEEPYDEAKERARARRAHEDEIRRGYQAHRQTVSQLFAQRQLPLLGATLAAGLLGFCTMPLLFEYMMGRCNECACGDGAPVDPDAVPTGLPPMGAAAFDVSLDVPERMMGVGRLRTKLAGLAGGDVLEVAVGTGRNIQHYAWNPYVFEPEHSRIDAIAPDLGDARPLTSFTGVDLSGDALAIARRRLRVNLPAVRREIKAKGTEAEFQKKIPEGGGAPTEVFSAVDERVRLFRGDALNPMPPAARLAPASRGVGKPVAQEEYTGRYDTVIQTFGLCSVADPVVLLEHMAAAVKPDSGRIVLLEHGRGQWSIVNGLLDRYAGRHFSRFGCWWNRDLLAIVDKAKAAVPGLEVVEVTRPGWFQFGTLYWIELRVKSGKP